MSQTEAQRRFGTFSGVFTPSILTIFGVIMFLRTGFVVGNAGAIRGVIIILISEAIVVLTALSISAIATNIEVKVGGAYFLISRSLGAEFGGAIGIVLYLSQAVSVAFYVVGFTEAFVSVFASLQPHFKSVALITSAVLFIITYIGAGWAIKAQFLILAALAVSIVSFLIGGHLGFDTSLFNENISANYSNGFSFWSVFAIFFPAVTGILAGVNMSGDLTEPHKNIPRGSLLAIGTSTIVYVWIAILLAGNFARDILINDSMAMDQRSVIPFSINIGVFAATLSSALGSFMGASRVLQALSGDNIFGFLRFFARGSGKTNEPRRGIVLTFIITVIGILLGDLNVIAPIITMFFMITYGMLNFATFYETVAANPSFRPRFRYFHWTTALLGTVGCLGIMLLIDAPYAIVSLLLLLAIYKYVERREITKAWGDATAGFLFSRARQNLIKMEKETPHPKNWRPSILVLTGNPHQRLRLVEFARWLEAGKGLIILGNVIRGEIESIIAQKEQQERILTEFIEDNKLEAFQEVIVAEDFSSGVEALIQAAGIGKLKPNTVMFGLSNDPDRFETFGKILRDTNLLNKNIVVVKPGTELPDAEKRIDIWWRGQKNGALMTLFAHLLTLNPEWSEHQKRILRVVPYEQEKKEALENLNDLIYQARIEAEPSIIVSDDRFCDVLRRVSARSSIVFMGLSIPEKGEEQEFMTELTKNLEGLPTVFLVNSVVDKEIIFS